jgi:hypothetical protein
MGKNLSQAKRAVREQFLGTDGIHAIGSSSKDGAIRIYFKDAALLRPETVSEIKTIGAPFKVELICEQAPQIQDQNPE